MTNKEMKAMRRELNGFDMGQKLLKVEVALGEFFLKRAEKTRKKQVKKITRSLKAANFGDDIIKETVKAFMSMDI